MTMSSFDEQIAYFFGAKETDPIAKHYLEALCLLNKGAPTPLETREAIQHLTRAYDAVRAQTTLIFDPSVAAQWECKLIIAHQENQPFDRIVDIMTALYESVFRKKSPSIQKAAWLRTFLYCYKNRLLSDEVSQDDQNFLLTVAHKSRALLDELALDKTPEASR